jgi:hypothetical protein
MEGELKDAATEIAGTSIDLVPRYDGRVHVFTRERRAAPTSSRRA